MDSDGFYDRCAISIPVAVSFKERDTTAIEEEKSAQRHRLSHVS